MSSPSRLTPEIAAGFARIALGHVTRPWPYKLDQVLSSEADLAEPRRLHPIFFGSFDWHSCVHGYWLLAAVRRRFPDHPVAAEIDARFAEAFTEANVEGERAFLRRPLSRGFERPYGWAWLLKLQAELTETPGGWPPWPLTSRTASAPTCPWRPIPCERGCTPPPPSPSPWPSTTPGSPGTATWRPS
jgi:hypothetical protein